jgi:hypothetical protein
MSFDWESNEGREKIEGYYAKAYRLMGREA